MSFFRTYETTPPQVRRIVNLRRPGHAPWLVTTTTAGYAARSPAAAVSAVAALPSASCGTGQLRWPGLGTNGTWST